MKIYNSLTRNKEQFSPIKKDRIGMYVCGPTVYDESHIGHARSAYIFDVIRRYLAYRGYKVMFVRNVTDVDDKIIEKAKKESKKTEDISRKYLDAYHEDMAFLGIGRPDKEPKATAYIPKMIRFIEFLIERGCAYAAGEDVYFDIRKAKDYGKLSNQNLDKMETGLRAGKSKTLAGQAVSPGENKRDMLDFALWKKAKEGEPSWKSPWGNGRPGWHVECSVMSSDILGGEFDIHGGGIDLIFPHHENEIAQSEGAGNKFARFWIHNGLLTIRGEKMAKSLGNFISIKDFVAKRKDADVLKMFFLTAHYSHPIDYDEERIKEAEAALRTLKSLLWFLIDTSAAYFKKRFPGGFLKGQSDAGSKKFRQDIDAYKTEFEDAMDDDFNMPAALAALFKIRDYAWLYRYPLKVGMDDLIYAKDCVVKLGRILGLFLKEEKPLEPKFRAYIESKIEERDEARRLNDFKKADDIREGLMKKGIILEDAKEGTIWRRKI